MKITVNIPPFVPIQIGGKNAVKDFDALLDTGSTYVIISGEDAIDLGYEPSHANSIHLGTAVGLVSAPLITLDYIEMFGFKIEKIEAVVKDLADTGINSVIGWSLLKYFEFSLNAKEGILEIKKC